MTTANRVPVTEDGPDGLADDLLAERHVFLEERHVPLEERHVPLEERHVPLEERHVRLEEPTVDDVGALFDRYAPQLWRYCARRVGPDLAEDVVAEVFLVAARRPERIAAGESPRAWLYGIATNLLRTHRRSEVRALKALERAGIDPFGGATGVAEGHEGRSAERADASRLARRLAGALAALPARQREVLLLYAVAELSYAEIAEATGRPLGSVQSTLHRARARMREALGPLTGEG
jgi:RNA polymerase sigma-70 factor (ECF subfamily)